MVALSFCYTDVMTKTGLYLVCKEHLQETKVFLSQFFNESINEYNHSKWVTFKTPEKFLINLMEGAGQQMSQNVTFEIYCKSLEEFREYAKKYNVTEIKSFVTTQAQNKYKYNYIEILGPQNICKFEISWSEVVQK